MNHLSSIEIKTNDSSLRLGEFSTNASDNTLNVGGGNFPYEAGSSSGITRTEVETMIEESYNAHIPDTEKMIVDYVNAHKEELKGDNGNDGHTPQKGIDYWTEADKAEIVNSVIAALPTAESEVY